MHKTILIIGGAGYIGSHIGYLASHHGYTVIILDNFTHNQPFNHPWATVIHGDYGNKQLLTTIFTTYTIDTVIHCAGSTEEEASHDDPLVFYENNVSKTIILLSTMIIHHITSIIFSSSCAIYGTPLTIPLNDSQSKLPTSPYGRTKLMIETILQDVNKAYNLPFIILRYCNVAGAYPERGLGEIHAPETHIIPLILNAAYTQQPFYLDAIHYPTPDGSSIHEFTHVRDIADAHIKALRHLHEQLPSDSFNIGTGAGFSIKQLISLTQEITNTKIQIIEKLGQLELKQPEKVPYLIVNPTRAHDILKWTPHFSDIAFIIRSTHAFNKKYIAI